MGRDLEHKKKYQKEYYLKNKERLLDYRKNFYEQNKEVSIQRSKTWAENNKRQRKHNVLKSTHGITIDDFEKMLVDQDYKCFCCSVEHSSLKKGLFVDHCHTTGKVRGLLCNSCNSALGYAKDNIEVLTTMIKYLQRC
jgi:hypothetical protein